MQPGQERRRGAGGSHPGRTRPVRVPEQQPEDQRRDDQSAGGFRVDLERKRRHRHRQHRDGGQAPRERRPSRARLQQPEHDDAPRGPDDQQQQVGGGKLRGEKVLIPGGAGDVVPVDEVRGEEQRRQAGVVHLVEPAILPGEEPGLRVRATVELVARIAHQRQEIPREVPRLRRNRAGKMHSVSPDRRRVGERELAEPALVTDLYPLALVKILAVPGCISVRRREARR